MYKTHAKPHVVVTSIKPLSRKNVYIKAAKLLFTGKELIISNAIRSAEKMLTGSMWGLRAHTIGFYYPEFDMVVTDFTPVGLENLFDNERRELRVWVALFAAAITED